MDDPGFESRQTSSEAHPASYSMGHSAPFPETKKPSNVANHSSLSGTKVKNERNYTSNPAIRLHFVQRDNFTFLHSAFCSHNSD